MRVLKKNLQSKKKRHSNKMALFLLSLAITLQSQLYSDISLIDLDSR